jgi:hypothetical protein
MSSAIAPDNATECPTDLHLSSTVDQTIASDNVTAYPGNLTQQLPTIGDQAQSGMQLVKELESTLTTS